MSGRLSTLPNRLWQAPGSGIAVLGCLAAAVLGLSEPAGATAADAAVLADRIAESLCYPPSVRALPLGRDEAEAYRRTDRMAGSYRDIQGADARAWFEKTSGGAVCRTPADTGLTLFFCAAVAQADGRLTKARPRLCS